MTYKEFIAEVSDYTGISQKTTKQVINGMVDTLTNLLPCGEPIRIRNFGSFTCKKRKTRYWNNLHPETGDFPVKEVSYVKFKPSKVLTDSVRETDE